MTLSLAKTN